ncbi:hypothetical protein U9M48_001752 [Paspalum notatum var. saurae]|uniref:Uncharacterized protein n=1 Tax=Paspalum notatum var. saurae TaxID=547442 RepID=A0AAQ3SFF6_PASNO
MADLVLGLAKTAVERTVMVAMSAIEEERRLHKNVQRDLILISDEFEMMKSFLSMAKDRVTDDVTRTIVRQVRSLALEVEDSIDIVFHLDNKPRWYLRILPSCCIGRAAAALDDAVAGLELLKARVEAMGQRNKRYSQISGCGFSNPAYQMMQQQAGPKTMTNTSSSNTDGGVWVWDGCSDSESRKVRSLIEFIRNEDGAPQLRVLSLLGTIGTMSVIKKAYDDPSIFRIFRCRAWVKLMHPFNPSEFIRSSMVQFCKNHYPQDESSSTTMHCFEPEKVMAATDGVLTIKEFMKQMNNVEYLVVLEDVTSMADWEAVRACLPDNKGSCIVVNTQLFEVASLCVGTPHQAVQLEKFSADHSVYVFFNKDDAATNGEAKKQVAYDWQENHQLVGREMDILTIKLKAFYYTSHVQAASVWGVPGVGKSSLVKYAFFQEMRNSHSCYKKFAWVNVSHPFNLVDLSRSLVLDMNSESLQHSSMLKLKDPIQECRDIMQKQSILVVIDGIQSREQWDCIKAAFLLEFGSSSSQSHIVVITNEESVAKYCAIAQTCVNIKGLQVDKALELFKKKKVCANSGHSDWSTVDVEPILMPILHKCGGLPKVIVAIADFVSKSKDDTSSGEILERLEWLSQGSIHHLENSSPFRSLQDLFSWVHSCFCSIPIFLKLCLFDVSIFPSNNSIRRRRLLRRWIALGYITDSKELTAEETAEGYLSKLEEVTMILCSESTAKVGFESTMKMPLCQVSPFYRE